MSKAVILCSVTVFAWFTSKSLAMMLLQASALFRTTFFLKVDPLDSTLGCDGVPLLENIMLDLFLFMLPPPRTASSIIRFLGYDM